MAGWADLRDLLLGILQVEEGKITIFLRKHSARKFLLAPLIIRGEGTTPLLLSHGVKGVHGQQAAKVGSNYLKLPKLMEDFPISKPLSKISLRYNQFFV